MPRLIIPIFAILLAAFLVAGSALVPGLPLPAGARQASPAADCPATTPEENEDLVRRYIEEAYNERKPDAIADLFADDFVRHHAAYPQPDQQPGYSDDIARLKTWLTAFPDLQATIDKLVSSGDSVAVYTTWKAIQDGPLPQWDAPETGRPLAFEGISIWRVACGRLSEAWIVQDNLTMLRQAGIITDDELRTAGTPTVATPAP